MTAFQGSAAALMLVLAMASHASPAATHASTHPAHVPPVAGAARGALQTSATGLNTLATSVQRGAVKDAKALDKAFDKARRALRASTSRRA